MTLVMKIDMRSLLLLFSGLIRLKGPKMSAEAYCALLEKLNILGVMWRKPVVENNTQLLND